MSLLKEIRFAQVWLTTEIGNLEAESPFPLLPDEITPTKGKKVEIAGYKIPVMGSLTISEIVLYQEYLDAVVEKFERASLYSANLVQVYATLRSQVSTDITVDEVMKLAAKPQTIWISQFVQIVFHVCFLSTSFSR